MKKLPMLAAGAAALAFAAPAAAAPPGKGLETLTGTCGGQQTTVTIPSGGGASFWIGDTHYRIKSLTFTLGSMSETKTFGVKRGLNQAITCTGQLPTPDGTVTFVVVGVTR